MYVRKHIFNMTKKYNWAGPNKYIVTLLNQYCYGTNKPPFALMIDGPRGCGKTWLVKRFFAKRKKEHTTNAALNVIYVSLSGIQDANDLTKAIYASMHPFWGKKVGELGKVLFKGLLNNTLNINLHPTKQNKKDTAILLGTPTPKGHKKNIFKDRILILDDIEHAKMPISDILALIHPLVESRETRVVLIAHEEDIAANNDEEKYRYGRIKEKTIYLTLSVRPDVRSTWKATLSRTPETAFTKFLLKHEDQFITFINATTVRNLRTLAFFMTFGSALFTFFKKHYDCKKYEQQIIDILYLLYGLIIEKCLHKRSLAQICEILDFNMHFYLEDNHHEIDRYTETEKAYLTMGNKPYFQRFQIYYNVYPILYNMLDDGKLDETALKNIASYFFQDDEAPSWQQLLFYEHENHLKEKGNALVYNFLHDFQSTMARDDEEVLHICDLYLFLHKLGVTNGDPISKLQDYIIRYIDTLSLTEKDLTHPPHHLSGHQISNYISTDNDTDLLFDIKNFFLSKKEEFFRANIPPLLEKIIAHKNAAFLIHGVQNKYPYLREMPYLHLISPTLFIEKLADQTAISQYLIFSSLNKRFQKTLLASDPLSREREWFEHLTQSLKRAMDNPDTDPLSKEVLSRNIETLQQA